MKYPIRFSAPLIVQQWSYWLTIAGIAFFHVSTLRAGHNWGGDFSQYIHHAKNLAEGKPYHDILYIVNSIASVSPATYPPVFPLILAPVYAIWGLNLVAMKLVVIGFFISALAVLKEIFQHRLSLLSLLALGLIIGLNPYFWIFKDNILSDIPYLFFSLFSLYLMRLNNTEKKLGISILLGIFMYLAYGTREIGVVLPLTLLTYEIWHYKKLTSGSLIAITLFVLFAFTQSLAMQFEPLYPEVALQLDLLKTQGSVSRTSLDYLQSNPGEIFVQINRYFEGFYRFWELSKFTFGKPLFWLLNGLALTGFTFSLMEKPRVTEIYFAGYFCALVLFTGRDVSRYLLPILPFYVFYTLVGISKLKFINNYLEKIIFLFLTLLLSYVYLAFYTNLDYSERERGITIQPAKEVFEFVKTQTQPDDVLVARKPRVFSLFTQRRASEYPGFDEPERHMQYLLAIDAKYLITQPELNRNRRNGQEIVDLMLEKYPENFSLIFRNRAFNVYIFSPE